MATSIAAGVTMDTSALLNQPLSFLSSQEIFQRTVNGLLKLSAFVVSKWNLNYDELAMLCCDTFASWNSSRR